MITDNALEKWGRIPRRAPDAPRGGGADPAAGRFQLALTDLGAALLNAAKQGDAAGLDVLIRQGAPVNVVDAVDRATALHYVAAYDARPALRVLLKSGQCDFLVRDWEGRLPSEIAREYGLDRAMARLLLIKELQQARAQGIDAAGLYTVAARRTARQEAGA